MAKAKITTILLKRARALLNNVKGTALKFGEPCYIGCDSNILYIGCDPSGSKSIGDLKHLTEYSKVEDTNGDAILHIDGNITSCAGHPGQVIIGNLNAVAHGLVCDKVCYCDTGLKLGDSSYLFMQGVGISNGFTNIPIENVFCDTFKATCDFVRDVNGTKVNSIEEGHNTYLSKDGIKTVDGETIVQKVNWSKIRNIYYGTSSVDNITGSFNEGDIYIQLSNSSSS